MSRNIGGPLGRPTAIPAFRKDTLELLTQAAHDAGALARVQFDHRPYLLVSDPHSIEEVLVRKHASFAKIPGLQLTERILGHSLLTSEGPAWRRQRQMVQPVFHHDNLRDYGAVITRTTVEHIERWPRRTPTDAARLMARLAFDVASRTLLGTDTTTEADVVTCALDVAMADFERRSRTPLARGFARPTAANGAFGRAARQLADVVGAIVDQRRLALGAGGDLVSTLLGHRDENGAPLPRRQIRDHVMTMLLAGHETTANALVWSLFLLSAHPDVRERMEAEQEAVINGRRAETEDLPRLPYTQAVLKEALRLYPPAWAVGRRSVQPFSLGGHRFPCGTHVLMSQWVVHRDAALYPDADAYHPERWLDEAWVEGLPRFAYFPFGGGPRGCIGREFALVEGPLILATISGSVRFVMDGPDPEPLPLVTLRPGHGVSMCIVDR